MSKSNSMTQEQSVLWGRVRSFEFDDPDAVNKFSERLARENRWTRSFTRRVIEEYRRFAFLSVAAGHPIAPSEVVDQAWHLHLIYTKSYWGEFCGRILGRPLHHFPSAGGDTEQLKLADWYSQTLQSYERLFGEKPPAEIWPSPAKPARQHPRMVHVDAARHWIVPKLSWPASRDIAASLALWLVIFTVIGCVPPAIGPLNWQGPEFLKLYFFLLAGATGLGIVCRLWLRGAFQSDPSDQSVPDFDPYEVAYLAGGERRVVNAAITSLVARNHLQVSGRTLVQAEPLPEEGHPLEHRLWQSVGDDGRLEKLHPRLAAKARTVADRLQDEGLVLTTDQRWIAHLCPPLGLVMLVVFGVAKTAIGLDRRRPVELLMIAIGLTIAVIVVFLLKRPFRTYRGDSQLKRLRQQHAELKSRPESVIVDEQLESGLESTVSPLQRAALGSSAMWPLAFALFGPDVLANGPMDDLKKAFVPNLSNAHSSDCATGCGTGPSGVSNYDEGGSSCGGGGGGGGGGCGGCGGGGD